LGGAAINSEGDNIALQTERRRVFVETLRQKIKGLDVSELLNPGAAQLLQAILDIGNSSLIGWTTGVPEAQGANIRGTGLNKFLGLEKDEYRGRVHAIVAHGDKMRGEDTPSLFTYLSKLKDEGNLASDQQVVVIDDNPDFLEKATGVFGELGISNENITLIRVRWGSKMDLDSGKNITEVENLDQARELLEEKFGKGQQINTESDGRAEKGPMVFVDFDQTIIEDWMNSKQVGEMIIHTLREMGVTGEAGVK
jgi:hypothetical protein